MNLRGEDVAVIAGFFWAVMVGGPVVSIVMGRLHKEPMPGHEKDAQQPSEPPSVRWHREALGIVERSLTVTAVLLRSPELVAAWLVFKAASAWTSWKDAPGVFNRYAVGTALSLAFGASGGALILALSSGNSNLVVALLVAPLALAILVLSTYDDPFRRFWAPTEKR